MKFGVGDRVRIIAEGAQAEGKEATILRCFDDVQAYIDYRAADLGDGDPPNALLVAVSLGVSPSTPQYAIHIDGDTYEEGDYDMATERHIASAEETH